MSSLVTNFLDVAIGPMERMVVVLEQAKHAPEKARAGLADAVARAEHKLLPALNDALAQQDIFLSEAAEAMKPATARAAVPRSGTAIERRPAGRVSTPVPLTGGSGRGKPGRSDKIKARKGRAIGDQNAGAAAPVPPRPKVALKVKGGKRGRV
jgi:hypothetical protein